MNNSPDHSFGYRGDFRGRGRLRASRARQWTARPQPRWIPPEKRSPLISAESRAKSLKLLTELAHVNNDGGVYTDDEEDLTSHSSISVHSAKEVSSFSAISEDESSYSYTSEKIVEAVVHTQKPRLGSWGDITPEPPNKCVSFERIAATKARMSYPRRDHHYFGVKENSDMEFVCARQHVFHVHRFMLEQFVRKRNDLINGNITNWDGMKRIFEILYNHRMSDEHFLKCTNDTDMRTFWNIGNSIMHLVKQLDIPVVKSYIDRAVGYYRCVNFRNCHSCTEHRRLFASVHLLNETKQCFFDNATPCDLEKDIDVMLRL